MVTHSPPTSEVCGSNPGCYVRKLVVATNGRQFTVIVLIFTSYSISNTDNGIEIRSWQHTGLSEDQFSHDPNTLF